jgi:ribosomal protein L11 methyltransferase
VVVANILAGPLVVLADTLVGLTRPGGNLALAGLTADQVEQVCAAYAPRIAWDAPVEREGWALVAGRRAG